MTELQYIGDRVVLHHLVATAYPEKVRIAELLAADRTQVVPIDEQEFEKAMARV